MYKGGMNNVRRNRCVDYITNSSRQNRCVDIIQTVAGGTNMNLFSKQVVSAGSINSR